MGRIVSLGETRFEVTAIRQDECWLAHAERSDRPGRYGPLFGGDTEAEATDRVVAWLGWQQEHEAALSRLQDAQRAYQRAVAGSAFATAGDGPTPDVAHDALDEMEAARAALEEIRERQPSS